MKKILTTAVLLLALAFPTAAQQWSVGAGTGPFIFGDFVRRTVRPGNESGSDDRQQLIVSAATRAGLTVDLERSFSDRWAVRLEGTFTRAPISIKTEGGDEDGTEIDAGDIDIGTFMLPLVFRINPRGAFRLHLHGGPALALYHISARENSSGAEPAFEGTKQEWGLAYGGGVAWWVSDRFAVEANLTDIVTSSPFDEVDDGDVPGVEVPRPHNVHTTLGVRWKF